MLLASRAVETQVPIPDSSRRPTFDVPYQDDDNTVHHHPPAGGQIWERTAQSPTGYMFCRLWHHSDMLPSLPIAGTDMPYENLTQQLIDLARATPEVLVLWLYGSRAKGNAGPLSDWDLAVAFTSVKLADPLDNRLRPELLALDWQRALQLPEGTLSVVDINLCPIPLAFAIIDANTPLYSRDEGRRLQEEARIMSQMEINYPSSNDISGKRDE